MDVSAPVSVSTSDRLLTSTRRRFLGLAGLVALAGFSGCSEDREPVTTETTMLVRNPESGVEERFIDNEEDRLQGGEWLYWEFDIRGQREIDYRVTVTEGKTVNTYLLEPAAFEKLDADETDFTAVDGSIATDVSETQQTVTVSQGTYYLIVINSDITPENA